MIINKYWCLGLFLVLSFSLGVTSHAYADAGVPMLAIVWPAAWILFIPIVIIEAIVARRQLALSWRRSLIASLGANTSSTLIGIPLTWIAWVFAEMILSFGGRAFGMGTTFGKIIAVTVQAAWLIPYESDLYWMVPTSTIVMLPLFYVVSVIMERTTFSKMTSCSPVEASKWSWRANTITYSLILFGLIIWLIWSVTGNNGNHQLRSTDRKARAAQTQVAMLGQCLEYFRQDTGRYPTTDEGLNVLTTNKSNIKNWAGPYLKKEAPDDPWGRPFHYQSPGTHGAYDLYSYGADGLPGGKDENRDITNWALSREPDK